MKSNRKLTPSEGNLIAILVKNSKNNFSENWMEGLLVRSMKDGGMGSILLFPGGKITEGRRFGSIVSEYHFKDVDGIDVIASLIVDEDGNLFELDIWKTDFSKLINLPQM